MTFIVACDLSHLDEAAFWARMQANGWAYLYDRSAASPDELPTPVSHDALPETIVFRKDGAGGVRSSLGHDHWRGLAGISRKVKDKQACASYGKFCLRAFDRVCDDEGDAIPFFEYYWAFFFNDAFISPQLWSNVSQHAAFVAAYQKLPSPQPGDPPSSLDDAYDAWKDVAALLVPLARSALTGAYRLPEGFLLQRELLGYVRGMGPIDHDDPGCRADLDCNRH